MRHIIIFCFLLFTSAGFAQNIRGMYKMTNLSLEGNNTIIPDAMKPSLHSFEYSKGKSLYKIYSSIKSSVDTVNMVTEGVEHTSVNEIIVPDEDTFFKDIKNNLYRRELSMGGKVYSVKDKLMDFKWELIDEKTIIKGYNCKKAKGVLYGYSLYAWYCEEIAISDGPSFYWGLPGLIIEINFNNNYEIVLTDLKIIKEDIVVKEPVNKTKMVTNAELGW